MNTKNMTSITWVITLLLATFLHTFIKSIKDINLSTYFDSTEKKFAKLKI